MKLWKLPSSKPAHRRPSERAFTLMEMIVASGISVLILTGAISFINFASITMSGITAQSTINDQAANAVQLFQSRARIATSVSNDATGTIVTLRFDDDYETDSDGDKVPYNDLNHLETFAMIGTSADLQSSTNSLVYTSTNGYQKILIPSGVSPLPGQWVFTVTNGATVLVRFGVVDTYARDRYQSIDMQTTAVLLNRRVLTNYIAILP